MANENNWVKILINKLGLLSTADFCRKTDLGRGLVDKLSAGDNNPRFDTLVKIKPTSEYELVGYGYGGGNS